MRVNNFKDLFIFFLTLNIHTHTHSEKDKKLGTRKPAKLSKNMFNTKWHTTQKLQ